MQDLGEGRPTRRSPLEPARFGPTIEPEAELDVALPQIAEHGPDGAELVEFVENQSRDELNLFVRVQLDSVAGQRAHVAERGGGKLLTAAGLVQTPLIKPLLEEVQFGLAHCPLEPQQQPVVV